MIKKTHLLLVCLCLTFRVHAQEINSNNTRPPFDLKLFVNDSVFYNAPIQESNYIINDTIIQIFPCEKLFIESEIGINNKLANFKVINEIVDSSKTLIVEFKQITNGRNHEQMMLEIKNPFKKDLSYRAMINLMQYRKWVKTSVIPVSAGLISYETWPDIITSIALLGFELK